MTKLLQMWPTLVTCKSVYSNMESKIGYVKHGFEIKNYCCDGVTEFEDRNRSVLLAR